MIGKRLICISGFTQSKARPNGIEALWLKLLHYERHGIRVSYMPWNSDWSGFAEHVFRTAHGTLLHLDVRCFCYSWGCGHGFLSLAREFRKRGMQIRFAVLSDPVYFYRWAIWRSMWSPLLGKPKLVIPPNVKRVWHYRQERNLPAGHGLVAKDRAETSLVDCGVLDRTHQYMDDAPEFHATSLEVAAYGREDLDEKPIM